MYTEPALRRNAGYPPGMDMRRVRFDINDRVARDPQPYEITVSELAALASMTTREIAAANERLARKENERD